MGIIRQPGWDHITKTLKKGDRMKCRHCGKDLSNLHEYQLEMELLGYEFIHFQRKNGKCLTLIIRDD